MAAGGVQHTESPHHRITASPHHRITASPHHRITASPHHRRASAWQEMRMAALAVDLNSVRKLCRDGGVDSCPFCPLPPRFRRPSRRLQIIRSNKT